MMPKNLLNLTIKIKPKNENGFGEAVESKFWYYNYSIQKNNLGENVGLLGGGTKLYSFFRNDIKLGDRIIIFDKEFTVKNIESFSKPTGEKFNIIVYLN